MHGGDMSGPTDLYICNLYEYTSFIVMLEKGIQYVACHVVRNFAKYYCSKIQFLTDAMVIQPVVKWHIYIYIYILVGVLLIQ